MHKCAVLQVQLFFVVYLAGVSEQHTVLKREERCPIRTSYQWEAEDSKCLDGKKFHCIEDNGQIDIRGCYNVLNCSKGAHPGLEGIYFFCEKCKDGFQPVDLRPSYEFTSSSCTSFGPPCLAEYGQTECQEATREMDRGCTCNGTLGFALDPSFESITDCQCFSQNDACPSNPCKFMKCLTGYVEVVKDNRAFCEPEPTTTPSQTTSVPIVTEPDGSEFSPGAIVAIIICAVVLAGVCALLFWFKRKGMCCFKKKRLPESADQSNVPNGDVHIYHIGYAESVSAAGPNINMHLENIKRVQMVAEGGIPAPSPKENESRQDTKPVPSSAEDPEEVSDRNSPKEESIRYPVPAESDPQPSNPTLSFCEVADVHRESNYTFEAYQPTAVHGQPEGETREEPTAPTFAEPSAPPFAEASAPPQSLPYGDNVEDVEGDETQLKRKNRPGAVPELHQTESKTVDDSGDTESESTHVKYPGSPLQQNTDPENLGLLLPSGDSRTFSQRRRNTDNAQDETVSASQINDDEDGQSSLPLLGNGRRSTNDDDIDIDMSRTKKKREMKKAKPVAV